MSDRPGAGEIARRLAAIRQKMAEAGQRSGRDPATVTLIGASKVHSVETLREAAEAGLEIFGENRVQEGVKKSGLLPEALSWHLIGPLQSNKAKVAVATFDAVHSVDRLKIARILDREAHQTGKKLTIFLEVNLGDEASKHGFNVDELPAALDILSQLDHLNCHGLMAIPPYTADPEASRPWFRRLRQLRDEISQKAGWEQWPGELSMGMSNDFEVAIEEGATHIRVGTALFGQRPNPA